MLKVNNEDTKTTSWSELVNSKSELGMHFSDKCNHLSSSLHFLENFTYFSDNIVFWSDNSRENLCTILLKVLNLKFFFLLLYMFMAMKYIDTSIKYWHFY